MKHVWRLHSVDRSQIDHEQIMEDLVKQHFGHLKWIKRTDNGDNCWSYSKVLDVYKRRPCCAFINESDCLWRVVETYRYDDDGGRLYSVSVDDKLLHLDHGISWKKTGLAKVVAAALSPNTLENGALACTESLERKGLSYMISEDCVWQLDGFRARKLSKLRHAPLSEDDTSKKNSFGRLTKFFELNEKEKLKERRVFHAHRTYVFDGWDVNQETNEVRLVLASLINLKLTPHAYLDILNTRFFSVHRCELQCQPKISCSTRIARQRRGGSLTLRWTSRIVFFKRATGSCPS